MRLSFHTPHPLLRPHVARFWVFESDRGIPQGDLQTIVPDGMLKLTFPFRGEVHSGRLGAPLSRNPEGRFIVIGPLDFPSRVTGLEARPVGTIGVEFRPYSSRLFLSLPVGETSGRVLSASNLLQTRELSVWEGRIQETESVQQKVALIEGFLLERLSRAKPADPIVEPAVRWLSSHEGAPVRDLEKYTGYSLRSLGMKFHAEVGFSPKALARIFRFQSVYQAIIMRNRRLIVPPASYADQAHFIREFKEFSGFPPQAYLRKVNDFGELFYQGISDFFNPNPKAGGRFDATSFRR